MANMDLSQNLDFQRLQNLQLAQVGEISKVNNSIEDLGKQISEICKYLKDKPPDLSEEESYGVGQTNLPTLHHTNSIPSIVDLDNPPYASEVIEDNTYTHAKHIKVNMPRFDVKMLKIGFML